MTYKKELFKYITEDFAKLMMDEIKKDREIEKNKINVTVFYSRSQSTEFEQYLDCVKDYYDILVELLNDEEYPIGNYDDFNGFLFITYGISRHKDAMHVRVTLDQLFNVLSAFNFEWTHYKINTYKFIEEFFKLAQEKIKIGNE